MTAPNLSALTDVEILSLRDADLRAALAACDRPAGIKVARAELLAIVADLLGRPLADGTDNAPPPPETVRSDLPRTVYVNRVDAVAAARKGLAALPVYGAPAVTSDEMDGLTGPARGLALDTGIRPVGGKSPVWAPLGAVSVLADGRKIAAPGKVQKIARWACAILAAKAGPEALPVYRVLRDEQLCDAPAGLKAAPWGGLALTVPARGKDGYGIPGAVVGYVAAGVIDSGAASVVKAFGITGVRPGMLLSKAVAAVVDWAVHWTATGDDGDEIVAGAWGDALTVSGGAWGEKVQKEARAALAKGGRAATTARTARKATPGEIARLKAILTAAADGKAARAAAPVA